MLENDYPLSVFLIPLSGKSSGYLVHIEALSAFEKSNEKKKC